MQRFFNELKRWGSWCEGMVTNGLEWIKLHEARPGLQFDCNVFQAPDGSVWGIVRGGYARMERKGDGPWTATSEVSQREDLVRSESTDDWAWYRPLDSREDPAHYWRRSVESSRRGMAFASSLLGRRVAVRAWAKRFAKTRRGDTNRDFRALVEEFFPFRRDAYELDIPDTGAISCSLHVCLDKLEGIEGREYWF